MNSLVVLIAILIAIGVTLAKGVRLVPQGFKFVVQRFGKFHTTLQPGLNFVIPYIDDVAYKITTKDIVLDIPSQEVITEDNAVIIANAVAYINIISPEKAVYGVDNYTIAIRTLVFENGECSFQAGAGVVADSVPEAEFEEVLQKSAALEAAVHLAEDGL